MLFLMSGMIMGGIEKVLLSYMEELQASGRYDCGVVNFTPVTDPFFLDFFMRHHIPLHIVGRPAQKGKEGGKRGFWARRIGECRKFRAWWTVKHRLPVLAEQYDVIIDFHNFFWGSYLHGFSRKRIGFCHVGLGSFNHQLKKRQKHLRSYDGIVCISHSFERDIKRLHPDLSNRVHCIYNPLDVEAIRLLSLKKGIIFPRPYFVTVQRLDADKDAATVVRAFRIFHKKHREYCLVIVGEGSLRQELEELSGQELAEGNIFFTGRLDNPYPVIRQAEALILSSTKAQGEGLGQVLIEAQALNVPAVSSDVPSGPAEVLMDGEAGYLFDPENPEALAQTLEQLVSAPGERAEKVRRASEGLKRFDSKECVKRFIDLIN